MKYLPLTAVIPVLIAGCSSGTLRNAGATSPASVPGFREASVLKLDCKPSESGGAFPPAVASALVGVAVDAAIGVISAALANAQKARTASWTASRAVELTKCTNGANLVLTRGIVSGATDKVIDNQSGPGGKIVYPAFVFTADIEVDPPSIPGKPQAGATITITPTMLKYAETAARSRGSGRKEVIVSIAFNAIGDVPMSKETGKSSAEGDNGASGGSPEAPAASAILLNLGKLEIGKTYTFTSKTVNGAAYVPLTTRHTASVIVTESENADVALTALAAAFEANKSDLGTALKGAITDALKSSGDKPQ